MKLQSVLFDLDGTLVDTAPDLGDALNQLLQAHDHEPLSAAQIRPYASHGSVGLIRLGFSVEPSDPTFESLKSEFLNYYEQRICARSGLFDSIAPLLAYLESAQIPWGIVTNKPAFLTAPLVDALKLSSRAACVVSGDTTAHRKPHPEPLFFALRQLRVLPSESLYIGDAERDVTAAKRAGMKVLAATYGYLAVTDTPESWGADALVHSPAQIQSWIEAHYGC
ncbi:MAG TPA: phosphoglycolate phosphatase [Gammaproteobacteria bacterium]|nr:phosphoglycolate phosphatase [Gammaproteobacteria bacterium]